MILNAGWALEALPELLRTPLPESHLNSNQSIYGRGLGISIWFPHFLGDSTVWAGLRIPALLLQANWESVQWGSLLTTELCQAQRAKCQSSTEPSSSLPAAEWSMLCAEPQSTSRNAPGHTSFLSRMLLDWVENDALDYSFATQGWPLDQQHQHHLGAG